MATPAPGETRDCPPWDPDPRPAKFTPPAGACDCHFHVFWPPDAGFAYVPERSYTPPDAPLKDFQRMQSILGLERAVIVHPTVYGADNSASLEAMALAGPSWRGVAVVEPDITEKEIAALHAAGVRGARVSLLFSTTVMDYDLKALAEKIAPFGWHIQLLIDISAFPDLRRTFEALPVDCVFDHMGHMSVEKGLEHESFQDMLALIGEGKGWAKLSGAYRITAMRNAPYEDVIPFARKIIETNPERCVWGTDWPHPACPVPMPNPGDLLDLVALYAPDEALRNRILVDNPAELYGFPR